jgi:Dyp-type peroxidase family
VFVSNLLYYHKIPQRIEFLLATSGNMYSRSLRRTNPVGRKQNGIEIPKASEQPHLLIIRLDLTTPAGKDRDTVCRRVQEGLKRLCNLFERLYRGKKRIDKLDINGRLRRLSLNEFNFSAAVGFGLGFFDKLAIPDNYRPKKLKAMPSHVCLGDVARYSLAQTDLIIQLGSTSDFVNRWVFENDYRPHIEYDKSRENQNSKEANEDPQDIATAIREWAIVTDMHAGFQRMDGRNLMGFNDGISNPRPGSGYSFDNVVWATEKDEGQLLRDGTYMVFLKIIHDLDQWKDLSVNEQEQWVGRNKVTGLLLGTPENDDRNFIEALKNDDSRAKEKLRKLLEDQSSPDKPFYDSEIFRKNVPAWSHVRKANPRQERLRYGKRIEKRLIFRRGYLFVETGSNNRSISGLLFICFQRDIENSFEHIKKNWLNNKRFPTPLSRPFTEHELNKRHSQGRYSSQELEQIARLDVSKRLMGLDDHKVLTDKFKETTDQDTQNTGREGLAGPSELGVTPTGDFLAAIPFGGGYYFIPPIPNGRITDIGQQFFKSILT